ncbi:hypothetical protein EVJ58_g7337 [Rhodofomes roseus]|uniref:Uncharacterized protein n=1 Tax=Rhodofomes roseus TaxID=34475 RepID=A0A4Y9Y3I8_9APHY|nr:hypothetical protein EVJ58_g7337 [Rhodofomes roseus]
MARGGKKLSRAQKTRNREAAARSLASRRVRKDAAATPSASPSGSAAGSIELLQQDLTDAACKLSAAKAEGQRSKAAAKLAAKAAKQDKYNAERRIHRLEAKLAERVLNTTAVPASPSPSTTFIPSHFSAIVSTSTTATDSDATRTLMRVPAVTTPAAYPGTPSSDLVMIPRAQLDSLRKERKKLLRQVERLRKRREQDKLMLLELRGQLRERPLKRIFPYKTKGGMVTEDTRTMIRELVALGVPHTKIKEASRIVLAAAGYATEGDFDRHSISRIVREGYAAAAMHVMWEVSEADSWTGSADGTGHKHIEHLSHHMYTTKVSKDPSSGSVVSSHTLLNLGVRAATGKTSEVQLDVLKALLAEYLEIYNESPLGQDSPLTLSNVLTKLVGWGSDHAEDQKKFFRLLCTWKQHVDREQRGAASLQTIMDQQPAEYVAHILRATDNAISAAGGAIAWDALSDVERDVRRAAAVHEVKMALGEAAFQSLSDNERANIDMMVWAGCAMHKEQNSVKGGATALKEYWKAASVPGPCALMNRDRATLHVQLGTNSDAAKLIAMTSEGGAVKLTTLAGAIFNHHDDKKGQQDVYRIFMEHAIQA